MLFKITFRKQPSISIALATVLCVQYISSNVVNSLEPPQDQKNQQPSSNGVNSQELPQDHKNQQPLSLPDEGHDWTTIRDPSQELLYIDKTKYLWNLVANYSSRRKLITRSRRFGKTTFLQMAEQYFKGNGKLFKGLFIEEYGNRKMWPSELVFESGDQKKWREYPVIYLNFGAVEDFETIHEFKAGYYKRILSIANTYELHNFEPGYGSTINLIEDLYFKFNKTPVIVLVDEYDFPYEYALSMNNLSLMKNITRFYDNIFRIMKNEVQKVGFLLIIGISKLALEAIDSGANNIVDETYNPLYSTAFGFTKDEIMQYMKPYIREFAKSMSITPKDVMEKLADHYDGYQYDPNNQGQRVFNPISTILSFKNKEFNSYWCNTGSMENIPRMFYAEGWLLDDLLDGVKISVATLQRGLSDTILPDLVTWMLYHGYFTIERREGSLIRLKIPNHEVETAINATLLSYDPNAKTSFLLSCKNELKYLNNQLNSGFVQQAVVTLAKIGFPAYAHPLNQKMLPYEVSRRLDMIFTLAGITHKNGIIFKKRVGGKDQGGVIDIWTTDMNTNYAIEVKTTESKNDQFLPIQGMNQLLSYTQYYKDSMLEKLENPSKMYLLSLAFKLNRGNANLTGWIVLPATNGIPEINEFKASSIRLTKEFNRQIEESKAKFGDPLAILKDIIQNERQN